MHRSAFFSTTSLAVLIVGIALGTGTSLFVNSPAPENAAQEGNKNQPLYWVAPMDPNYKRDNPGKSPMGMDLIPVYANPSQGDSPGTITIAPEIINNLGIRTGVANSQTLQNSIVTVGYVRYDENLLFHIHPRMSGWIEKLYVKAAGDPVHQGAPLYSLYSPELVNAQEELILAIGRKNQRLVASTEERLRALQIDSGFIKRLKRTGKIHHSVTFFAPHSGVVDNLAIREGFYVEPGTTLFSIGSLDKVWVEAEVFERQAAFVSNGDPVTMTLDYLPDQQWQGSVDYIYPTLNPDTRTVRLRLGFDNPGGKLKPNMFAEVTIQPKTTDPVLAVPREALIRTGQQDRVVLALGEGRFKSVAVQVGKLTRRFAEITGGLIEGERVVLSAQFLLDSESSKTSDFRRMAAIDEEQEGDIETVWVGADITAAMPAKRTVTARHDAIDTWDWPEMIMDFPVAEGVDINELTPGTVLHMEISKRGNHYEISGTHIMQHGTVEATQPETLPAAKDPHAGHADMDHSKMDHSNINHEGKPSSEVDHSKMNHGDMSHD